MAHLTLQWRLKLLLNGEGNFGSKNPVHSKLNGGSRSGGVLGFGDFCSIFPFTCLKVVLVVLARPVNVVCWKRALCLEFMEKADVLEYYDQTVNSPSGSFNIPAVLQVPHLLQVMKRKKIRNTLSRKNLFYRDDYMCQYCSATSNLTVDHVVPISQGGKWEWENLVTACAKCNSRKGKKTLEEAKMNLKRQPKAPKEYDILAIPLTSEALRMLKIMKGTPQEWHQYLPN
ncbi:hypothetical protein Cgig2_012216 [Carnegiea gigantea]|uniref:HNH nuclease domain-containing protein n=1 Tax=Carnegiea gigantea TaxID=171969 RepID=A0A9Q1QNB4_9CARY|nr:hypothetical protein Cgig2_012216 [Carnegiea gigantea]